MMDRPKGVAVQKGLAMSVGRIATAEKTTSMRFRPGDCTPMQKNGNTETLHLLSIFVSCTPAGWTMHIAAVFAVEPRLCGWRWGLNFRLCGLVILGRSQGDGPLFEPQNVEIETSLMDCQWAGSLQGNFGGCSFFRAVHQGSV
uniref:Uncharacterized protein n=1 Tax=Eutreptiella gymnastica TaxID=73025 RepID=A0A7S1ILH8_9EUGL|mmetsp:Transcript_27608/g.49761  ORF Transcript_27608/g.49761 Transcript_27608/m.49761 type:complete len:143 (+) Transcript_27608:294-722(+)